jgi:hypothetical protein
MTAATHAIPPHLIAFWREVQALLDTLFGLIGAPELLARRYALARDEHRLFTHWLRAAEAFLRRLILIEAAETPVILKSARKSARRHAQRAHDVVFDPDHPESWRVSFRIRFAQTTRGRGGCGHPIRFYNALPLAKRYEALLRAYNDPRALVQRAAKRLKREPLVSLRLFEETPHPSTGVQDSFDKAGLLLEAALRRDSS